MNNIKFFIKDQTTKLNLDVIELEITHNLKDNSFATARMVIVNIANTPLASGHCNDYIFIKNNENIIFKGVITESNHNNNLTTIILTAKPTNNDININTKHILKQLQQQYKDEYSHLLFDKDSTELDNLLEINKAYIYCCPVTHDLSIVYPTKIFEQHDKHTKLLSSEIISIDNNSNKNQEIINNLRVEINSSWIQQQQCIIDLDKRIKALFPGNYINSLTGSSLRTSWWKEQTQPRNNGYYIIKSSITEFTPPSTGTLNLYPQKHGKFADKYFVKRTWFETTLELGCCYQQKRKETMDFTIDSTTTGNNNKQYKMTINISGEKQIAHNYCSFFLQDQRAYNVILCAQQAAKQIIKQSLLNKELIIKTTNQNLKCGQLIMPPNQENIGIITQTRLHISGEQQSTTYEIRLATSSLQPKQLQQNIKQINSFDVMRLLSVNIPDKKEYIKSNIKGLNFDISKEPFKLIKNIRINNNPEQQLNKLLSQASNINTKTDLQQLLSKIQTTIEIDLLDLNSHPCLEHSIKIN